MPGLPLPLPLPAPLRAAANAPFVGRTEAMATLRTNRRRGLAGERPVVLIGGEPGIGKTRLAAQFAAETHSLGMPVLFGRCDEEAALPFQPFVEAIRFWATNAAAGTIDAQIGAGGADLARLVPELSEKITRAGEPVHGDGEGQRYRLLDAVAALLENVSARAGLVLVLEDLQWADRLTLLLVKHLARSAAPARLVVVGTYREPGIDRDHPLTAVLADLRREPTHERLLLRGLDEGEIGALLQATAPDTGAKGSDALLRVLREKTEGNPFFLIELMKDLKERGKIGENGGWLSTTTSVEDLGVPDGVKEVLGRRLARLSADCYSMLMAAAVLGREFELDVLERIGGIANERLFDVLDEAVTSGLVNESARGTGYRFAHSLVRETLYAQLSAPRRAGMHNVVAETMEALGWGAIPARRGAMVHHYLQAGGFADGARAGEWAIRAGDYAMAQRAYEEAVWCYGGAIEALGRTPAFTPEARFELLLAHTVASHNAGEQALALESRAAAIDLARAHGMGRDLARATLVSAIDLVTSGVADQEAVATFRTALRALPEGEDVLRAAVLSQLTMQLAGSRETRAEALVTSAEAVVVARRSGDATVLADALFARRYAIWRPETIQERLTIADEILALATSSGDPEIALKGYHTRIVALEELGDVRALEAAVAAHGQLADTLRVPYYRNLNVAYRMMLAGIHGRFHDAVELASDLLTYAGRGHNDTRVFAELALFVYSTQVGESLLPQTAASTSGALSRFWASGCMAVAKLIGLGLPEEARSYVDELARDGLAGAPVDHTRLGSLCALAEQVAAVGSAEQASVLYDAIVPFANLNAMLGHTALGPVAHYLGLLAGRMGEHDVARAHFEAAIAMAERMGALPWQAAAEYALAELLASSKNADDRANAERLAGAAHAATEKLGMRPLAGRAAALWNTLRPRRAGSPDLPAGLTAREAEVLRLVASGCSNQEIAESLVISIKTVERHVANVYTKIDVRGRVQAAAFAQRNGLAGPPA